VVPRSSLALAWIEGLTALVAVACKADF